MSTKKKQAENLRIIAYVVFGIAIISLAMKLVGIDAILLFSKPTTISGAIGAKIGNVMYYGFLLSSGYMLLSSAKNRELEASYEDGSYKNN